jgi:hypothetical protein
MRRIVLRTVGVCLAPLVGLGLLRAVEPPKAGPATPPAQIIKAGPATLPTETIKIDKTETSCGSHGTSVEFLDTPSDAATKAKKEQKLVFVLHVSGNFEDPKFT